MRRNVMISTATALTAIAATALGGITAASASAATGVPTTLTGSPGAAIAVSATAPIYVETGTGPGRVCAIALPAPTQGYAKRVAKGVAVEVAKGGAIAVAATALGSTTKPALALSGACPARGCAIAVPATALTYAKGDTRAPAGLARPVIVVRTAGITGAEGSAGPAKIAPLKPGITCLIPAVAAGVAVPAK